ncbi:alanine/glycine:cation symporter family protein [Peptostreptococcus canis]|uniref:Alanine:cation symporter family protein n=1 Tax=Peptostreptococcus canis TaxID=1159213 RepID=A0ABR6TKS7_9FIRM|nr:alanine/glycine:cation symporter family protein [Peptostreptococcus canis]MBC2575748.1 alanine:cation symporter family protein [Peptostreptococcus canis]MBP1998137.1 AGCS family alanine or glycine:cation symporter [Peptostreptococcus canis]
MEFFNSIYNAAMSLSDVLWSKVLIVMLVGIGIYFTIRTRFVQFRFFGEQFKLLVDTENMKDAKKKGGISSFGAFCISTASRVGTGNIAGIALAIVGGGPGAIFWMWLIALIGSASAFVEATLAQIFKVPNGTATKGGPAYYMEQALNARWLGIIFAILITITYAFVFNAVQANTMSIALNSSFGLNRMVFGIALTIITGLVIFGGVHRISKVSEIIVPVFAVLYILIALIIIIMNIGSVPGVIRDIVVGAFNPQQFVAGTGAGIMATLLTGAKRGLFSNEAGMGSAPNASATADVSHPVAQGLIQSLGVFTDTIIICSCTAFMVLLFNGYAASSNEGILLAQEVLIHHLGPFGGIFLSVCIFLFAFSSIVGNYYYGESNIQFMVEKKESAVEKIILNIVRTLVCLFVFYGSLVKMEVVWNLADLFMALMSILNLIVILILGKYAYAALTDYSEQKKKGISKPTFHKNTIPEISGIIKMWENK